MSTASTYEQEMLALINQERTSRGLNPLKLETRLNDSSEDHSTWMLSMDTFSHTGSGGSSATERMEGAGFDFSGNWRSGENIAWQSERGADGISDDVVQLHQSLMNSPGHRANILNPDYEYIGIGIEEGDYNGWNAVMVTQNFATTDGQVVLDTGPMPILPADAVADPIAPVADDPDTDVADVPVADPATPDPDVIDAENPDTQTPDTIVAEAEEPGSEAPDADVTEPEMPDTAIPDTDVTETEEPGTETPGIDTTGTEDTETPETDTAESDATDTPGTDVIEAGSDGDTCFDVDEFLATIKEFVNDLVVLADDIRLTDKPMAGDEPLENDLMLISEGSGDTPDTTEDSLDTSADPLEESFNLIPVEDGCMLGFV